MTPHTLNLTPEARRQLDQLKLENEVAYKAVARALKFMAADLRHPGLKTHRNDSIPGPHGAKVFEAYAQNRTPGARRVFFCYGPGQGVLTILAILKHPED